MPIAINGSGSITGISAGGLPDGCVTADDLASGVGGKILQVVNIIKTDTFSTTSTTPVDITGFSVTITPSSSSNKVLLLINIGILGASGGNGTYVNLLRGSTAIAATTIGSGNLDSRSGFASGGGGGMSENERKTTAAGITFLDTPNTTSATTYKIQISTSNSSYTSFFNRWGENTDNASVSTITAMEVAA